MSNEPLLTQPTDGRPEYTDEQYQRWLDLMAPYLKLASTLYWAMEKADILTHRQAIYRKYRLNDWFCEKVDAYRRQIGEITNNATVRLLGQIDEKLKQDKPLLKDELDFIKWFAEKHRTAQPFFVTRTEQVIKDDKDIGRILDVLEETKTNYAKLGESARIVIDEANKPKEPQTDKPSGAS